MKKLKAGDLVHLITDKGFKKVIVTETHAFLFIFDRRVTVHWETPDSVASYGRIKYGNLKEYNEL